MYIGAFYIGLMTGWATALIVLLTAAAVMRSKNKEK